MHQAEITTRNVAEHKTDGEATTQSTTRSRFALALQHLVEAHTVGEPVHLGGESPYPRKNEGRVLHRVVLTFGKAENEKKEFAVELARRDSDLVVNGAEPDRHFVSIVQKAAASVFPDIRR